jgi:hypothetical protein
MSVDLIKKRLYLFIRARSKDKKVTTEALRLWAKNNEIDHQDMGYAIQLLKNNGAVYYSIKHGWIVR